MIATTRVILQARDQNDNFLGTQEFVEHTLGPSWEAVIPLEGTQRFFASGRFAMEVQTFAGQDLTVRTAHLTATHVGTLTQQPNV